MSEVEGTADNAPEAEVEAPAPSRDKRQYRRFKVNFKVFIRLSEGGFVTAQAVDLSMGGIFIEYGASAEANKEYDIAFDLTFAEEFKRVLVKAKIVRSVVIANRNVYGLAFVFSEFVNHTDEVLEAYLQLRSKKVN